MVDVFQAVGTVPVAIDRLNSLVNTGVILEAVILSIFPVIPSGPHALVVSNAFNILNTSTSVHSISAGQARGGKSGAYSSVSGGKDWLKQVAKNALKAFAFSDAVDITIPL